MGKDAERFSQLSPPRQVLVRLFQATNYGYIDNLDFQPVVAIDLKLDTDQGERAEIR